MTNCRLSTRKHKISGVLVDSAQAPGVSDHRLDSEYAGQNQGNEGIPRPWAQPQLDASSSSSGSAMPMGEIGEAVTVTSIRATDVTLGLGRVPAGFYAVVRHSGHEWRTERKRPSVNHDVVEWNEPIPIPSDLSATVRLEVYAYFELQPALGVGEQLRELTVPVEQLLEYGAEHVLFTFFPKDGDVVSPRSSILVTIKRQKCKSYDSSALMVFDPHCSTTESRGELEDATNQGQDALLRLQKYGGKRDLERSIEQFESTLSICPLDHPCLAAARLNLAMANLILCWVEDTDAPLDLPLNLYRNPLTARPVGHVDRHPTLVQLSTADLPRFGEQRGGVQRARADGLLHEVMELSSKDSHENRATTWVLQPHAGCTGGPVQADDRSSVGQDSAPCSTDEDPWISSIQLVHRFQRFGNVADLQQAITVMEELARSTSGWDDRYSAVLGRLGLALLYRFNHIGELSDLGHSISTLRDAVDLTPRGHPHKPDNLNNLGSSFFVRFERLGELSDLENAIARHRDAVDLTPAGHPHQAGYLNSLGLSFFARFERLGGLSDLEDAISKQREAVDLTPRDHPHRPARLNNLGNSFRARFEHLGELTDLEDAISTLTDAVNLTPHDHPQKPSRLNNLAGSFKARFERVRESSDLEHAILMLRDAVDLTPRGHPYMASCLNNLGNSFRARFECLGELNDLGDAIAMLRDAVDLTPHDHPHKPNCLNNLGNSFFTRFDRLGELSDLEDAISTYRDATYLTPHGHPHRSDRLNSLGNAFEARFKLLGDLGDAEQAISLYSDAASAPIGPITIRFHASRNWISCARHIHHHSLLSACSVAITLFPQLAWSGLSLPRRYSELMRGEDVVRDAAAVALDLGLPGAAVEWLEQGRSIVWGELVQLRGAYEELSYTLPHHARRLCELSAALEHASAAREKSLSALSEQTQSTVMPVHGVTEYLQQEADKHRMLAIERDKLLHEIRGFPGFERFLLHKQFSRLRASAHSGPVVILNAAESRCDALIVLADADHVIHVPLPDFTFRQAVDLRNTMVTLLGHARASCHGVREGCPSCRETRRGDSWECLLSSLWKGVVKPVLDALAFATPGDLSRIFWCPTGPFVSLPIHAAGFYDVQHAQPGHKVSDFVVSSYVPTLSTLALSPNFSTAPIGDLRLLTVRQPPSDGLPRLPGVATELAHIREIIKDSPSAHITLLESSDGTVEEVLSLMKEADWVHFACHGVQDATSPTDSGLCLADQRRLKLRDMIALSRPRGGLAFLSACQTAMGDEHLSDEAVHIAAGMLFAGYGGVVGTMWSISDKLAPDVARDVYGQLFRNGTRPDYREAARALHEAIGRLRHGNASFVEWLPFIHVGL